LYLVTPNWNDTDRLLDITHQALRAGASLVQYRHKDASSALRIEQAHSLLKLCRQHGRPLVINDHLDLCMALDVGGFYPSTVKKYAVTTPADIVARAKAALRVPVVVIGGMTPENARPLAALGADMVAAISSVCLAPDPYGAAREFAGMF
jgi:thiamine-phosphate pyrophosphorylase